MDGNYTVCWCNCPAWEYDFRGWNRLILCSLEAEGKSVPELAATSEYLRVRIALRSTLGYCQAICYLVHIIVFTE